MAKALTSVLAFFSVFMIQAQTVVNTAPQRIYDNDVAGGAAGPGRLIRIRNTGASAVSITRIALAGTNANQFVLGSLPVLPRTINAKDSISISVAFNPSVVGLQTAAIAITTNETNNPTINVPLRGLGTPGIGGSNEPSLQAILNLREIPVSVGDDDPATNVINSNGGFQKAALLGEEIGIQRFVKAGAGNVTIEPLAVFGPGNNNPVVGMGWYASGNVASRKELFTVANTPATNAQTVNPVINGTLLFDPGTASFGFYSRWPFFGNRHLYSEDNLNTFTGSIPHHVRVFPYRSQGLIVANTYVVAFEEHTSGFDYQDLVFIVRNVRPASEASATLLPAADGFVRQGAATTNYGRDTILQVKSSASAAFNRRSYLRFALTNVADIRSAKLRIYGRNTENTAIINLAVFGVDNDAWTEQALTFNNAPATSGSPLATIGVNNQARYYEVDVTNFVRSQFARDKMASFALAHATIQEKMLIFSSKEHAGNPPQLVVTTGAVLPPNNTLLFVENLDRFPANDQFVTSRIQVPWSRDNITFNANHDTVRVRIHNKGLAPLVVSDLLLSNQTNWKFLKLRGANFNAATAFPLTLNPGSTADLTLQFVLVDNVTTSRIRIVSDNLTIVSNDEQNPYKVLTLQGLWQKEGESFREPDAQRIISAFGFKTKVGFSGKDPDLGNPSKPKGDEILSSYFVRADPNKPITVRQMAAYHGCCTQTESFKWFPKGTPSMLAGVTSHIGRDAQSLLPRRSLTTGAPAEGSFSPNGPIGFKVGSRDFSDTLLNPSRKIGLRVWKVYDHNGQLVPNHYIIANDYLGTSVTNYDYNDNVFYVTNIKPETGRVHYSELASTPSAVDFGEKTLQSTNGFTLNLKNMGKTYGNGTADPALTITSIAITGDHKGEFSASMPATATLNPQQSTSLNISFRPASEGLKTANLLIYYNNAGSPYRVPLYGIGKAVGTTVKVHYRIKSGSPTSLVVNGKTWSADAPYAFDNLEPYTNTKLTTIAATDEDQLYLSEQSSNGDRRPFRYEIPVANGTYQVRLHFAEIYWGTPGSGLNGGTGSRVMSVTMENQLRLANLDLIAEVGAASALVKLFTVTVTDGKLNINFSASANRPMVSAVEVYSFSRATTSIAAAPESRSLAPLTETLRAYPNPSGGRFHVDLPSDYQGTINLMVTDLAGRKFPAGRLLVQKGEQSKPVDLTPLRLQPGSYLLELHYENRAPSVLKIMLR